MGLDSETLTAVNRSLKQSAANGNFVPWNWLTGFKDDDEGGCGPLGCIWLQFAWAVAVQQHGESYARCMLPIGSGQTEVNAVLKSAGFTRADIKMMDPQAIWEHFDEQLDDDYENRHEDSSAFIAKSLELATLFIGMLQKVPTTETALFRTRLKNSARAAMMALCVPFVPEVPVYN
jgi:hypothetical protein